MNAVNNKNVCGQLAFFICPGTSIHGTLTLSLFNFCKEQIFPPLKIELTIVSSRVVRSKVLRLKVPVVQSQASLCGLVCYWNSILLSVLIYNYFCLVIKGLITKGIAGICFALVPRTLVSQDRGISLRCFDCDSDNNCVLYHGLQISFQSIIRKSLVGRILKLLHCRDV